eukprot:7379503-Prymnesium_polylepis.1
MKFGSDSFAVRDATQAAVFFRAVDLAGPTLLMMSPPCKSYSTADFPYSLVIGGPVPPPQGVRGGVRSQGSGGSGRVSVRKG